MAASDTGSKVGHNLILYVLNQWQVHVGIDNHTSGSINLKR